jgi:predicted DNA-binding protein (MmcQ/YjbR family)
MDGAGLKDYCLSKKGAVEDFPFGEDILTIKVAGKIFAFISNRGGKLNITLKCDPIIAMDFRQRYLSVIPGYHLNKKHWNTVIIDGSILDEELKWMINHSYELVVKGLTKAERRILI